MAAISINRHVVHHGVVRWAVAGDVSSATSELLTCAIRNAIFGGLFEVVVDVSRVTRLDASGIGALLRGQDLAAEHGVGYRLIGGAHTERLDIAGLPSPGNASRAEMN